MTRLRITLLFGGISVAALAMAAQAGRSLVIDGNTLSSNVMQQSGCYWVRLDDVAKYFGYTMSVTDAQAALTRNVGPVPPQTPTLNLDQISGTVTAPSTTPVVGANGAPQQFVNNSTMPTPTSMAQMTEAPMPTLVTVSMGQNASVSGFNYKVVDIRDVGREYRQTYDQHGSKIHPKFKTDTLVAVDIEETNGGTQPVTAYIPEPGAVSVVDSQRVGYQASYLDIRQSTDLSSDDFGSEYEMPYENSTVTLLPGGTIRFAVVASVPANSAITGAVLEVRGYGSNVSPAGAIVTVNK